MEKFPHCGAFPLLFLFKANWVGHIVHRNCLLQQVIDENLKGGYRSDRKTRKKT